MSKLTIQAKCSDLFNATYVDDDGLTVEHYGYVPSGIGISEPWSGGDYITITIDTETGQIEGWKPLKKFQVLRAFQDA